MTLARQAQTTRVFLFNSQVSGIATTTDESGKPQLYVLLRADNPWDDGSFDSNFEYGEQEAVYVKYPILHVDVDTGRVLQAFGSNLFYIPHGLSIAKDNNGLPFALWVTDLALHQVMKFDWGKWEEPSLVLGREGKPGNTTDTFCQPADVAVASTVREAPLRSFVPPHRLPLARDAVDPFVWIYSIFVETGTPI